MSQPAQSPPKPQAAAPAPPAARPAAPPPAAKPAPPAAVPTAAASTKSASVEAKGKSETSIVPDKKAPDVAITFGKKNSSREENMDANQGVIAICPPLDSTLSPESKQVRSVLRRKKEAFKPLPVDDLKKLVREDDFIVDFYLSCAPGTSQGCAEKMKDLATKAKYSCFMAADAGDKDGSNLDISLNLHRCKAFVILITKQWLESPACEFEYMLAQRLNMTSSRPVILPVMCEELNVKDFPIMSSILGNLPKIDLTKSEEPERGLAYALAMIEFLVSPSLLRLPAWRRQREALAYLSSELMVPTKQYSQEMLPSGDYIGFFSDLRAINSSRQNIGDRFLFRMSLKFETADENNNNNKDKDGKQKSIEIDGVGEDGVDIFRVEKGNLSADGDVEILKKYVGKMSYRIKMTGKAKNFVLSGTYAYEESKTPGGYWIMWPMRVYWKYRV